MTFEDWQVLCAEMQAYWDQKRIEDPTIEAWYADVEDLPVELVREAFREYTRTGANWAPTGGQLRRLVVATPEYRRIRGEGVMERFRHSQEHVSRLLSEHSDPEQTEDKEAAA